VLELPLPGGDYLNFTRVANLDDASLNVGALVAVFRKTLSRAPEPAGSSVYQRSATTGPEAQPTCVLLAEPAGGTESSNETAD
jgi:hypothetical protein